MQRITKTIAEAVADALLKEKRQAVKSLETSLQEKLTLWYTASLPSGVNTAYAKFKRYFNTTSNIRLSGTGLSQGYKYYTLAEYVPITNDNRYLNLSDEQADIVVKIEDEIELKNRQLADLRVNITAALLNLRTYANVQKSFPEAVEYLPTAQITTLAININDLRPQIGAA